MKVILVGCVKSKQQGTHAAEDLYTSPLFAYRSSYARAHADRWFILSALHGLLLPGQRIDWYEQSMRSLTATERRQWSEDVLASLRAELTPIERVHVEIHAGHDYLAWGLEDGLKASAAQVTTPLKGMGFGLQLRWYKSTTS